MPQSSSPLNLVTLGYWEYLLHRQTISLYASAPAVIGQDLIGFPFSLFLSLFFLLLTHFYFSLFFSRMRYIQFFAFSLSILCPFFFHMISLNIFLYSPWCLYFAFKDRGGAGKKEERRTKIKLRAVCYRVEGKLSGCRELHPLPWSSKSALWEGGKW